MLLNLGSARWPMSGWINVDLNPAMKPSVVADVAKLPFQDAAFDEIYAGHILEHMREPVDALKEWARVLVPNGKLTVCVPDIERGLYEFQQNRLSREILDGLVFGSVDLGLHFHVYTRKILLADLSGIFDRVENWDKCPYHVGEVKWQLTLTCRKCSLLDVNRANG